MTFAVNNEFWQVPLISSPPPAPSVVPRGCGAPPRPLRAGRRAQGSWSPRSPAPPGYLKGQHPGKNRPQAPQVAPEEPGSEDSRAPRSAARETRPLWLRPGSSARRASTFCATRSEPRVAIPARGLAWREAGTRGDPRAPRKALGTCESPSLSRWARGRGRCAHSNAPGGPCLC